VTDRNRPLGELSRLALLVAAGDWLTKSAASRFVGSGSLDFTDRLRFAVVHNDAAAFGLGIGTYAWQINLAVTLAAIAFIIPVSRDLARIDPAAPRALGLIVGGALGNFGSLLLSPKGVVDFIAVGLGAGTEIVLNVADLAAYVGLAMMIRTAFLLVGELRRSARPTMMPVLDLPVRQPLQAIYSEREVALPVLVADAPAQQAPAPPFERPQSVRHIQVADRDDDDPKVIDIRPHLLHPRVAPRGAARAARPPVADSP
jgi:lipoprotein signal peptidase